MFANIQFLLLPDSWRIDAYLASTICLGICSYLVNLYLLLRALSSDQRVEENFFLVFALLYLLSITFHRDYAFKISGLAIPSSFT